MKKILKSVIAFLGKPYRFGAIYTALLLLLSTYLAFMIFVFPHDTVKIEYNGVEEDATQAFLNQQQALSKEDDGFFEEEAVVDGGSETYTIHSYRDDNIRIEIKQYRRLQTDIYVADVQINKVKYLKTAFANDTFGVHITQFTSDIAKEHNAILAVNGDYFGYHDESFVLRNGTTYRSTARTDDLYDDLVLQRDGTFQFIEETKGALKEYENAWQVWAFGPALLENGKVITSEKAEVARCKASNPRTAIGRYQTADEDGWLHYCLVTSDGRTEMSAGLTLYQLAEFLGEIGCDQGYNLDGGGSTSMVFHGQIINYPTNGNNGYSERGVSDIVYIGY